ncbi:hypothetical protein D7030_03370 [Flavobacteriaceae bacterium AU392]|nr:hypothetical protein D1817_09845 [Flavobacteriaceae bacterium]RKM85720.1 hypothetical protein D7030_03370 [Flavobacteriaceae bacterium AU392]
MFSQNMDNIKLGEIIASVSDSIQGNIGRWQFVIKNTPFICVTDETNNRMRIISPIAESSSLDDEMKTNALVANFHSALDVKYAISDGILWSAYIHPLKELTEMQVKDAISQVFFANRTFGTTYSSTDLIFGGNQNGEAIEEKEKKPIKKEKF